MATFKDILQVGSIALNGDGGTIEVRVIDVDGKRRLDIRKFVATQKYTGPTQQGISLDQAGYEALQKMLAKPNAGIKKALAGS